MTLDEVKVEIDSLSVEDRAALRSWLLEHFKAEYSDRPVDAASDTVRKQREAEAWDQEDDELV